MQLRAQLSLHEMRLYLKKWMVAYVSMKCDRSLVPCAGCAGRRVFSTRNVPQTAFEEPCPDHDPQVSTRPEPQFPTLPLGRFAAQLLELQLPLPCQPPGEAPSTLPFPAVEPAPAAGAVRIRLQVHEARPRSQKYRAGSHAASITSMPKTPFQLQALNRFKRAA